MSEAFLLHRLLRGGEVSGEGSWSVCVGRDLGAVVAGTRVQLGWTDLIIES